MKILAIGAHPDDVEVSCGATLALFKKKGHQVYILTLTKGEASGDPKIREKECVEAGNIIGVDELFFGNLRDTQIHDGIETITEIEKILKIVKPDLIFCHSARDSHQDHRNVSYACISAARMISSILLYESPAATKEFSPQIFVNVLKTFHTKLEAIRAFPSQTTKSFFPVHTDNPHAFIRRIVPAVEGLARFRGFQVGVDFAEAFEVSKFILEIPHSTHARALYSLRCEAAHRKEHTN